ncbi:hypothetical protein RCH23_001429 [Cryobacterium sp. CAN_C3]|uniref:hypothetical protein n=1 Tax=unclassified Cryobacterium TaxID=2649013 RepID=UPI0018C9CA73|nr:hypothetical protein [Cryobacterium sp. CAN_C3]MEC5154055.1 hypothetical protein [Cryobacterium sp. CAN_C3]
MLRSHTWRTVANSAAYLIPELCTGGVLLDVGCGPGTITVDLARRLAPDYWNGGDPDAGRSLKSWARRAGFTDVTCSASVWCFASDAEREWWGESWAVRLTESSFAAHAIESGVADLGDLKRIAVAWREWVRDPNGWFGIPHGEILARG